MATTNLITSARHVVLTDSFRLAAHIVENVIYPANHVQVPARIALSAMILYSLWAQLVFAQIYLLSHSQPLGIFFALNTWMCPSILSSVIQSTL